jgi:hypothetical protein
MAICCKGGKKELGEGSTKVQREREGEEPTLAGKRREERFSALLCSALLCFDSVSVPAELGAGEEETLISTGSGTEEGKRICSMKLQK